MSKMNKSNHRAIINNEDLKKRRYSEEILIDNIDNLFVTEILRTQKNLSRQFIDQYIFNEEHHKDRKDEDLTLHAVIAYQPQYAAAIKTATMEPHSTPIAVEEAICRVLKHTKPARIECLPLSGALLGRTLAEELVAAEPHPPFPASIMDGYAVKAPLQAGVYPIASSIHAGAVPDAALASALMNEQSAVYITTGAVVPEGANAVVKVEDTELVAAEGCDTRNVRIKVEVPSAGLNVRQVGSDVSAGEVVLPRFTRLGPTELGLLATTGFSKVRVFAKPVVGVMSTGDELVDATEPVEKGSSKIRDSNRLALLSAFQEDGYAAIDLGIVNDSKANLKERLLWAADRCDVVVSSGGVSMGAADYIKPLLAEIGTIHFSKLKMKPGKPTTFASFENEGAEAGVATSGDDGKAGTSTLFFGLPGNPVSCLVTKALFVDVALRRLQGLDSEACLHAQVTVRLTGSDIVLDAERPEYHRVIVVSAPTSGGTDGSVSELVAISTGNQRSSRLLSMRSANALLFLPKGPGVVRTGSLVNALLIRPLQEPPRQLSVHPSAAALDFPAFTTSTASTASTVNALSGSNIEFNDYESSVDVMQREGRSSNETIRALDTLDCGEVCTLLDNSSLSALKAVLMELETTGMLLSCCDQVEDVKELGITRQAQARMLYRLISDWKQQGVPAHKLEPVVHPEAEPAHATATEPATATNPVQLRAPLPSLRHSVSYPRRVSLQGLPLMHSGWNGVYTVKEGVIVNGYPVWRNPPHRMAILRIIGVDIMFDAHSGQWLLHRDGDAVHRGMCYGPAGHSPVGQWENAVTVEAITDGHSHTSDYFTPAAGSNRATVTVTGADGGGDGGGNSSEAVLAQSVLVAQPNHS